MLIYMHGRAIRETRVPPPSEPLVRRELSGPLAFKEEDGFGESISIVVAGKARVVEVVQWFVVVVGREGTADHQSGGATAQEEDCKCQR